MVFDSMETDDEQGTGKASSDVYMLLLTMFVICDTEPEPSDDEDSCSSSDEMSIDDESMGMSRFHMLIVWALLILALCSTSIE